MWFFDCPHTVFGEGSSSRLEQIQGARACIATDENIVWLGQVEWIRRTRQPTGILIQSQPSSQTRRIILSSLGPSTCWVFHQIGLSPWVGLSDGYCESKMCTIRNTRFNPSRHQPVGWPLPAKRQGPGLEFINP